MRAYWHRLEVADPRSRSQDTASAWRACVRLPRCFTDPTFLIDRIRREHSPPLHVPSHDSTQTTPHAQN